MSSTPPITSNGMNNSKSHVGISNRRRRTSSSRDQQQQRQEGRTTTDILGLLGRAQYKTRRNSSIIKTTDVSFFVVVGGGAAAAASTTANEVIFVIDKTKTKVKEVFVQVAPHYTGLHFCSLVSSNLYVKRMGYLLTQTFSTSCSIYFSGILFASIYAF